jgi:hypothetical protein
MLTLRMISPIDAPPETRAEPLPQLTAWSEPPWMGATGEQQTPMMTSSSRKQGSANVFVFTEAMLAILAVMKRQIND